jgi:hypothetical protein
LNITLAPKEPGKKRKAGGASKATAIEGKTCHLRLCCDNDDSDGPGYDLWRVLFKCPKTTYESAMARVRVRRECQRLVTDISKRIQVATANNAASMASTAHAGVDHAAIGDAATDILIRIAQTMTGTASRGSG